MKFDFATDDENAEIHLFGCVLGENSEVLVKKLRETSRKVEVFDVESETNPFDRISVFDVGNVFPEKGSEITSFVSRILRKGKFPLMISKSHLSTYFSVKAFDKVKLLVFDAHGDAKDVVEYIEEEEPLFKSTIPLKMNPEERKRLNSTTWLRRCVEEGVESCVVGLRSCDEFDLKFLKQRKVLYVKPSEILKLEGVKKKIEDFVRESEVYVSVDIDVFDPSIAPAVDYPEPFGINFYQFREILSSVFKGKVVGADVVEVVPRDGEKRTEFLAIKVILEIVRNAGVA